MYLFLILRASNQDLLECNVFFFLIYRDFSSSSKHSSPAQPSKSIHYKKRIKYKYFFKWLTLSGWKNYIMSFQTLPALFSFYWTFRLPSEIWDNFIFLQNLSSLQSFVPVFDLWNLDLDFLADLYWTASNPF